MTTYTTPHFATGSSDRNLRPEPSLNRTRPAAAATSRAGAVPDEAALLAEGPTPDWEPGASRHGVPKAAIGALGAALVGGVALAIVLLAPSNEATRPARPGPVAQAASGDAAAPKSADSTDAAVDSLDKNAPAAGNAAAADASGAQPAVAPATGAAPAAAVPAPVQSATPDAPPMAEAPVGHVHRHVRTQRDAPQPAPTAPAVMPDMPQAPAAVSPADLQAPAMQQTPDMSTVTPSAPAPAPAPTPDTPAPNPAPAQ